MMSSVSPSARNSCSGSPLMLTKGITAIDGLSETRGGSGTAAAAANSAGVPAVASPVWVSTMTRVRSE